MKIKIVADSSANMHRLEGIDFACAPLTIRTDEREFVDNESLDILEMVDYLAKYKGKSGSACPGVGDWLDVFGDADEVYCVTIISTLSGSYNAAMTAKAQYEEENPGKKVFVLDSYSAGPEPKLLIEKIRDLVLEGKDFETVCKEVLEYKEKSPDASFIPLILGCSDKIRYVSAVMPIPVRDGTLYRISGTLTLSATYVKCLINPACVVLL